VTDLGRNLVALFAGLAAGYVAAVSIKSMRKEARRG
jgi:hypothetical protein